MPLLREGRPLTEGRGLAQSTSLGVCDAGGTGGSLAALNTTARCISLLFGLRRLVCYTLITCARHQGPKREAEGVPT